MKCVMIIGAVLLAGTGCRPLQQVQDSRQDTVITRTEITHRDTVITIPADRAALDVRADIESLRSLITRLEKHPIEAAGKRQARLMITDSAGRIAIRCRCDSLRIKLDHAITTIATKEQTITRLNHTVREGLRRDRSKLPGWMKGTAWILVLIIILVIVVAFLFFRSRLPF